MIFVNNHSIVYILAPANANTGGPEAEHQLASQMIRMGIDSRIVYINHAESIAHANNWEAYIEYCNPPKEYLKYGVRTDTKIISNTDNILIVPEVYVTLLQPEKHIQQAVWWLAVPLFPVDLHLSPYDITHFFQAEYIKDALKKNNLRELYSLSDYTREKFLQPSKVDKKDIVVYNPAKGSEYTQQILDKCPDIQFVPICGMAPEQVHQLLLSAKVYIDFGHHPGKDRIPREAAISGCCVVVGKRGSAQYFEDVPIKDIYKIETSPFDVEAAVGMIKNCIQNYNERINDFSFYRNKIRLEKERFQNEIREIFTTVDK
ncbi:MAG: hypothetical protein ABF904_13485 [Ethanoligenens sp.]